MEAVLEMNSNVVLKAFSLSLEKPLTYITCSLTRGISTNPTLYQRRPSANVLSQKRSLTPKSLCFRSYCGMGRTHALTVQKETCFVPSRAMMSHVPPISLRRTSSKIVEGRACKSTFQTTQFDFCGVFQLLLRCT